MKHNMRLVFACLGLVWNTLPLRAAPIQVHSCAVLPFDAADGPAPRSEDLGSLTRRYSEQLAHTAAFGVVPVEATQQILRAAPAPGSTATRLSSAVAVGKQLGVSHVIAGRIEHNGEAIHLVTTLIDCRRGEGIRGARSTWHGTFERFLDLGPASNLKTLLRDVGPEPPVRPNPQPDVAANTARRRSAPATQTDRPVPARPPPSHDETNGDYEPPVRAFGTWSLAGSGTEPPRRPPEQERTPLSWQPALALLEDRLDVGARFTSADLDQSRGSFLGTINRLEIDSSSAPFLFAEWAIIPYASVELTWDRVEAVTRTYSRAASDGNVVMDGPVVLLYARYPWDLRLGNRILHVVPYAGIGRAFFSAKFDSRAWWGLGFSSTAGYDQWRAAGAPGRPNSGYTRSIRLTDDDGFVFALGCSARVWDGVSVELAYRTTDLDTEATFTRAYPNGNSETVTGRFPMSYSSLGLGVRYSF